MLPIISLLAPIVLPVANKIIDSVGNIAKNSLDARANTLASTLGETKRITSKITF